MRCDGPLQLPVPEAPPTAHNLINDQVLDNQAPDQPVPDWQEPIQVPVDQEPEEVLNRRAPDFQVPDQEVADQ